MKAILEFNLPEDKTDFTLATNGGKLYSALWDYDQYLRTEIKYNYRQQYQDMRDKLADIMHEHQLTFDMVD